MKTTELFEIREIEAWAYDDTWNWDNSYFMGNMATSATNINRAFTAWLRKKGIVFKKNRTIIEYDGDIYTILDRKTKEPLFVAIPSYND